MVKIELNENEKELIRVMSKGFSRFEEKIMPEIGTLDTDNWDSLLKRLDSGQLKTISTFLESVQQKKPLLLRDEETYFSPAITELITNIVLYKSAIESTLEGASPIDDASDLKDLSI